MYNTHILYIISVCFLYILIDQMYNLSYKQQKLKFHQGNNQNSDIKLYGFKYKKNITIY